MNCEHCAHPTGQGYTAGYSGHDALICCKCGIYGRLDWHVELEPVPGHGPHFKAQRRVDADTIIWVSPR